MKTTAFLLAVCKGLRPNVSGCSPEMKTLMSACWDADPHLRPCLCCFFFFLKITQWFLSVFTFFVLTAFVQIVNDLENIHQ